MDTLIEAIRYIQTTELSNRDIAQIVGFSHTTIAKYRSIQASLPFTWQDLEKMPHSEVEALFRKKRGYSSAKQEIDLDYVHSEMQKPNVTLELLHDGYRLSNKDNHYKYSSFARKYAQYKKRLKRSMRFFHKAGEAAFVDFAGTTVSYRGDTPNEKKHAQIFISVLGASDFTFVYAVESQSLQDWIEAHNAMFHYFRGVPKMVVCDNLKSAVTKAGKEPVLNRTYLELGRHYGTVIVPTRPYKPKDKSKAENAVLIASRWILARLRNRTFFSIHEINEAIRELLIDLNNRPFKKLPGCRRSRHEEVDLPALNPLPDLPYEYAKWVSKQKVGPDYHIHVKGHYYSLPHQLVGDYVEARATKNIVEFYSNGKRVASHRRNDAEGHTTLPAHQPEAHRAYANLTPEKLDVWAEKIGPSAQAAVKSQFDSRPHPVLGIKACTSLQKLAREYGNDRFEAACRHGQRIGSLTVTSLRSILRNGLAERYEEQVPLQLNIPLHANVRGSEYYAN